MMPGDNAAGSHIAPVAPDASRMLVTGANGFLGRRVVAAAHAAGFSVTALVRPAADLNALGWEPEITVVRAADPSPAALTDICRGIDVVVHLAASMTGSDAQKMSVAVDGTAALLDAIDPATTHFVLASSFSVYDWSRTGAEISEDSPLLDAAAAALQDGYTRAKLAQEQLARAVCAQRGIALTVVRPAAIWGPGQLFPSALGVRVRGWWLAVDARRVLRLTYVDNCASAFVAAAQTTGGQTFNVDDGFRISAWDYLGKLRFRVAAAKKLHCLPLPRLAADLGFRLGGWAFRLLRPGREMPGLLIAQRADARFSRSLAGHAALHAATGWNPPYALDECLRLADDQS
ncbi:MAG: hypothetical protein JWP38_797 [Herbaspirillum sp.]|nr:hypothetical protein [Herbaspirillum sp.]